MGLRECTECQRQLWDQATTCPHCGWAQTPGSVVTIEQTGKRWKLVRLASVAMMAVGLLGYLLADARSLFSLFWFGLAVTGVVAWLYGRLGAWWHHG